MVEDFVVLDQRIVKALLKKFQRQGGLRRFQGPQKTARMKTKQQFNNSQQFCSKGYQSLSLVYFSLYLIFKLCLPLHESYQYYLKLNPKSALVSFLSQYVSSSNIHIKISLFCSQPLFLPHYQNIIFIRAGPFVSNISDLHEIPRTVLTSQQCSINIYCLATQG